MSWNTVAIYNGAVIGNATTSFTRALATQDGFESGERRFKTEASPFGNIVTWADNLDVSAPVILHGSGPDADGTPLVLGRKSADSTIRIYSLNTSGNLVEESSTALSDLVTQFGGGVAYRQVGGSVFHGLIMVALDTSVSSVSTTLTIIYSQDKGATWHRVQDIGGGYTVPELTGIGAYNDANTTRGQHWAGPQAFPVGGIDSSGNYDSLACWFCGTDYIGRDAPNEPKGGLSYLLKATRASISHPWVVDRCRVIYEEWGSTTGVHAHCAAVVKGGLITVYGDARNNNHIAFSGFCHNSYKTGTITSTQNWCGVFSADEDVHKDSPQPVAAKPGRGNSILFSADLEAENILKLEDVTSASDLPQWSSPLRSPRDTNTGTFYKGYESLVLMWYPGGGYTSGGAAKNQLNPDTMRHYSADGENWVHFPSDSDLTSIAVPLDTKLVIHNATSDFLAIAPLPNIYAYKPLQVAPGGINLMTEVTQRTAPTSPNTARLVSYSGGIYTYNDDSSVVVGAPTVAPPRDGATMYEYKADASTSYTCGIYWMQTDAQTIDSDKDMMVDMWVYNLSKDGTIPLMPTYGPGVINANTSSQRGYIWTTNSQWHPIPLSDDKTTTGLDARGAFKVFLGRGFSIPANAQILMCYGGLYESTVNATAEPMPWPGPRDATDQTGKPEVEKITNLTPSTAWTVAVVLRRPLNTVLADGPLFTVWVDADNHVVATWDSSGEEIVITSTVATVAQTTMTLAIGEWERELPLYLMISDDGTDLECSAYSMQSGIIHDSEAAISFGSHVTDIRLTDAAGTGVSALEVLAVAYDNTARNSTTRAADLADLNFLDYEVVTVNNDPHLVLHLKLDEAAGATTFVDSSGNSHTGTKAGTITSGVTGKFGSAVTFGTAAANYILLDNISLTGIFTLSLWIKRADYTAIESAVGQMGSNDNGLMASGTYLALRVNGTSQQFTALPGLSINTWQHVCITRDASDDMVCYVGGSVVGATKNTGDVDYVFGKIGSRHTLQPWNGQVDDVRIYSRVLSPSEIKTLATNPYGNAGIINDPIFSPTLNPVMSPLAT